MPDSTEPNVSNDGDVVTPTVSNLPSPDSVEPTTANGADVPLADSTVAPVDPVTPVDPEPVAESVVSDPFGLLEDFDFDSIEDFEEDEVEPEPETPAKPSLAEMNAATRRIRR